MEETEVVIEPTSDSQTKAIVDAIAGGDNVAAATSFDQAMQAKVNDALEKRKQEFSTNMFTPPEPTTGIDTGITGDPAEVSEEE